MELKPCPFCGCTEAATHWHCGYWSVTCGYSHDATPSKHCFQDLGEFDTEEQAIIAWNNRPENILKNGKWISKIVKAKRTCLDDKFCKWQPITCSICKEPSDLKYNYCPHCGASMDLTED